MQSPSNEYFLKRIKAICKQKLFSDLENSNAAVIAIKKRQPLIKALEDDMEVVPSRKVAALEAIVSSFNK